MKCSVYCLIALLALGSLCAGCGKAKPEAPAEAAAPAPAAAEETVALEVPVIDTASAPAPEEPALSEAEAAVVVAKVDGTEITEGEIHKVLSLFKKQMGARIPPDQMDSALPRIRERIIEELIMRRVMLAAVAKEGISLSDSEFEQVKTELAEELPPGTTLEAYMEETGTSEADMREQMAVRKMVLAKAEAIAKPGDEEIQAFYEENQEGFSQGETVTAAHILIKVDPADDEAAKTAKRERLEGLRKQLLEGGDFAEVAKANSECPSAASGGDLGSFGRGQMVPEFEEAAFSQPAGSVGEIVETQFGFHLIKVSEHAEAKTLGLEEVKTRISDMLYSRKQQEAVGSFVEGLRSAADIQRFDNPPAEETLLQLDQEPGLPVEPAPEAPAVEEPAAEPAPVPTLEAPAPEETAAPVAEAPAAVPAMADPPVPDIEVPAVEAPVMAPPAEAPGVETLSAEEVPVPAEVEGDQAE